LRASSARLTAIHADVARVMPLTPIRLQELAHEDLLPIEALLKKCEQLIDGLGAAFRTTLILAAESVRGKTGLEILDRMESLGVIASADRFSELVDLRNALAHEYPLDAERQVSMVVDAWTTGPELIATVAALAAFVAGRKLLP
jgi:uncharacterized protein YutE (UPF0331/DUF86 family)